MISIQKNTISSVLHAKQGDPAYKSVSDFVPAAFFFFRDFAGMPVKERTLCALFQSVTTRTAGFNTADLSGMTGASQAIMIVLMMIGGAPGSTAGGMKITTFAVLTANASATFRQREDTQMFGRRVGQEVLKKCIYDSDDVSFSGANGRNGDQCGRKSADF